MSKIERNVSRLLNDRKVADLLSVSLSYMRQQRHKRKRGEPHAFDVDPVYLGDSPRYRESDVLEFIERCAGHSHKPKSATLPDPSKGAPSGENRQAITVERRDEESKVLDIAPWADHPDTRTPLADNKIEPARRRAISPPKGCRFIDGDPKLDPSNCGEPCKPGSSYCAKHHARCWTREGLK